MTKKRLKDWVLPTLGIFVALGSVFTYFLLTYIFNYEKDFTKDTYTTDVLIEESVTVNEEINKTIIKPFTSTKVAVSKYFYHSQDESERQTNSLIKYQNIYMPNTGILYSSDEKFDILAVDDGKVTSVKKDEILGYIIEIEHTNNVITIYQSVSDVKVEEGATIKQGDIIASSGSNSLENEKENCLHFEVYKDGKLLNPESVYNIETENIN
jgi:stage II sporulation protein Q